MVAAASSYLNLPSFWLEQPHTWFNMCESAFATCNIVIVILGKSTNRRYLNLKVDSIDKKFCRSTRELAPGYGDLVWVFSKTSTPQCHNIILHTTHTHTLTTTLTFTHTHDWPTVASMTSGSWGFRFLQMGFLWDHKWSTKRFSDWQEVTQQSENIFLGVRKLFQLLCLLWCRHYAANLGGFWVGLCLIVKLSCWK